MSHMNELMINQWNESGGLTRDNRNEKEVTRSNPETLSGDARIMSTNNNTKENKRKTNTK